MPLSSLYCFLAFHDPSPPHKYAAHVATSLHEDYAVSPCSPPSLHLIPTLSIMCALDAPLPPLFQHKCSIILILIHHHII